MLEKSRNAMFLQWFVCRASRKVGLLKWRVRRMVLSREIRTCTPLWRKAHFEVKMYKTPHARSTFWSSDVEKIARRCGEQHIIKTPQSIFWSSDVEKLPATVARSAFDWKLKRAKHLMVGGALFEVQMSKNCRPLWRTAHYEVKMLKKLGVREHFLKLWCRQIARCCGEKHILKSKCTKHLMLGALFEVLVSKKCTPLWRKAHFEVKMYKTPHARSTFWNSDVEKLHAAVARSTCPSQNV